METYTISFENYQQVLNIYEELKKDFSNCFFPLGQERPLKVRIYQDLMKIEKYRLQKEAVDVFFKIYTNSVFYRASLIFPDAIRVDLNGNEVEKVYPRGRFIAKVCSRIIFFKLDKEGYEQKKRQAHKLNKLGKKTPEIMRELFKNPKAEKPIPTKKEKPLSPPKPKKVPEPPKPKIIPKASKPVKPKKPVVVIVKKKKKIIPDPQ